MLARLQIRGREVLGLHIGKTNARRFFPAAIPIVQLELDHLRIDCELKPGFWRDRPEITDSRLCAWLAAKCSRHERDDMPTSVEMLNAGEGSEERTLRAKHLRAGKTGNRFISLSLGSAGRRSV